MAVPVHGVGVSPLDRRRRGVARQPVLPEYRLLRCFEMRFVPHVATEFSPVGVPRMEVSKIDSESLGVGSGGELRLTRYGPHMGGVGWFAQSHIIISTYRIGIGLSVDILGDVEIHAATHILYHETVAAGFLRTEIHIPHIGAYEIFPARLVLGLGLGFPELDRSHHLFLPRLDII